MRRVERARETWQPVAARDRIRGGHRHHQSENEHGHSAQPVAGHLALHRQIDRGQAEQQT